MFPVARRLAYEFSRMKRYIALADELTASIRAGQLRPGDRLPSVRHASRSRRVSPATVFQAYYLLEARGLIAARARSGYYVTALAAARPRILHKPSTPKAGSIAVDVGERVFEILGATMHRDVVPLGSAFPAPTLFPLARLAGAMASAVKRLHPRTSVEYLLQGNLALRQRIALRYALDGMRLRDDDIVITNGAMEALNLCLAAVTRPGDAVVIESPAFYAALQALERNGLRAIEAPTHPQHGIDLNALETILREQRPRACWLMPNFQNPLGSLMPEDNKRQLVDLLTRHDTPLIEDDVYAELYFGERRPLPAKAFDRVGIVLHCSSFSKCLAPGYRIGWAIPGRYAQAVARLKLSASLTASVPAEAALATYLQGAGYDRHLRTLRRALAAQRDHMLDAIGNFFPAATSITLPQGGYFMWLQCPRGVNAIRIHELALAARISVAPGPIFSSRREFRNCLRLNYGHPWSDAVESAVRTLGQLVAQRD
jgi:DNA-binding transcriptional MocR family regulator